MPAPRHELLPMGRGMQQGLRLYFEPRSRSIQRNCLALAVDDPAPGGGGGIGSSASGVLNREEVLERVGGDAELLREIVELFLDDLPAVLGEIETAVRDGDVDGLRRAAHRLKGAAANFSAHEVVAATLALESMARAVDLSGAEAGQRTLRAAVDRLRPALAALVAASGG